MLVNLNQFMVQVKPSQRLFVRLAYGVDNVSVYECSVVPTDDDAITVEVEFKICICLMYLHAQIVTFDCGKEISCGVYIVDQHDRDEATRIKIIDSKAAKPLEANVQNAMVILQQQAEIERRFERRLNAQKKI